MRFENITLDQLYIMQHWRNEHLESLRTPHLINDEMQEEFYHKVICNRNANSKYWAVMYDDVFIGMVGIQKIEWENSHGELSFFLNPTMYDKTVWGSILSSLIVQCFDHMNLYSVYLEIYECNQFYDFYATYASNNLASDCTIPYRKYYDGRYYNSKIFTFCSDDFS